MPTFKNPPLTPEELAEPLQPPSGIKRAINTGLGGLAQLGNLLDLPGSTVRDALSLKNPLDQWLTPFSPDNRTSGRDMLRSLGLISQADHYSQLPAAIGLEVALDPLTYLSLGTYAGASAGGKAARAVGILDKAATVATGRNLLAKEAAAASKATGAAIASSKAFTPPVASKAAEELVGAGLSRSTLVSTAVGHREAVRKLNLKQLVEGLSPTNRTKAIADLDNYAKQLSLNDANELLAKFGDEPLAASGRIGIPLTGVGATFESSGLDRVGRWMDLAGSYVKWSAPGRAARALFVPAVRGLYSHQAQQVAEGVTKNTRAALPVARAFIAERVADFEGIVDDFGKAFQGEGVHGMGNAVSSFAVDNANSAREALLRVARLTFELEGATLPATNQIAARYSNALERAAGSLMPNSAAVQGLSGTDLGQKIGEIVEVMRNAKDSIHGDLLDSGVQVGRIDYDWLSHFPRYGVPKSASEFVGMRERLAPSAGVVTQTRERALGHLPAELIEAVLSDPLARQSARKGGLARVKNLIQDWTGDINLALPSGKQKVVTVDKQAKMLHAYVKKSSPEFLEGRRLYANSAMEDFATYLTSAHRIAASRDATFETLLRSVDDMRRIGDQHDGPLVSVAEALSKAGYDPARATLRMAKMSGAGDPSTYAELLAKSQIPLELSEAIKSVIEKSTSPEYGSVITFHLDKATRFLKEHLTLPFPAFSVRNAFSAQLVNAMSNHMETLADYDLYRRQLSLTHDIRVRQDAHADIIREMYAHDVFKYGYHAADIPEFVRQTQATLPAYSWRDIRGVATQNVAERGPSLIERTIRNTGRTSLADNAAKYLDPIRRGHETVLEAGRRAAATGEWYGRVPMYLYLKEKGFSPAAASQIVRDLHVDYSDLAPFEKTVMRRAALFYTFTRKQLEQTVYRLMEKPGGLPGFTVAGTIKAVARARNPNDLTPDYVAETASIPLGRDKEGNQDYLTGLGLAFEDPLSFFGKGPRGAIMEGLSRLHPLAKAPLEYGTGELFFQAGPMGGRDLSDADPLLGRTLANITGRAAPYKFPEWLEVALANSPASRVLTTARQVFDPRKSLETKFVNLGTGVRIATISPAAQEAILREQVSEQLRQTGARQFTRTYVPEEFKASMSPQNLEQANKLMETLNELARRTRERKRIRMAEANVAMAK